MAGNLVNEWPIGSNPKLLDNGHLLTAATDPAIGLKGFQELDWEGNVVWEYWERREDYDPHHDFLRIFNKKLDAYTTLYIANKSITHDEAIAAGCDPDHGPYDGSQMDAIVEVDMQGNIVWEWWFLRSCGARYRSNEGELRRHRQEYRGPSGKNKHQPFPEDG